MRRARSGFSRAWRITRLGLALGYGREKPGRVGQDVGFNAYPLRTIEAPVFRRRARRSTKTGETYPLRLHAGSLVDGRPADHSRSEPRAVSANIRISRKSMNMRRSRPVGAAALSQPVRCSARKPAHHQWGMSIDLNACVGCSACMMACQSENNIPIVGKDQVATRPRNALDPHRPLLRRHPAKERFATLRDEDQQQFESGSMIRRWSLSRCFASIAKPRRAKTFARSTPPSHDQEGLNVMVYNRCVGTRYCSNNCPYKVRRFNFFDYNKRPLEQLKGPFTPRRCSRPKANGTCSLVEGPGSRQQCATDEWELLKMVKNPDVTVRMRGVMEKCTFCVQRIEGAKIAQKVKARRLGRCAMVPDGHASRPPASRPVPAEAIVFGNIADPEQPRFEAQSAGARLYRAGFSADQAAH